MRRRDDFKCGNGDGGVVHEVRADPRCLCLVLVPLLALWVMEITSEASYQPELAPIRQSADKLPAKFVMNFVLGDVPNFKLV